MQKNMKRHLSYRFMPMIILSYLFINLYFVMTGASWCKSEGCEISKSLLNIEQIDLYYLAIAVFCGEAGKLCMNQVIATAQLLYPPIALLR